MEIYPAIHSTYESFRNTAMEGLNGSEQTELLRLTDIVYRNVVRLIEKNGVAEE